MIGQEVVMSVEVVKVMLAWRLAEMMEMGMRPKCARVGRVS